MDCIKYLLNYKVESSLCYDRKRMNFPDRIKSKSYQKVGANIRVIRSEYVTKGSFHYYEKEDELIGVNHYLTFLKDEKKYLIKRMNKDYIYLYACACVRTGDINIKEDYIKDLYLTYIYDLKNNKYLTNEEFMIEAQRMKIFTLPILYEGPFISERHIENIKKEEEAKSNILFKAIIVETYENWNIDKIPLNVMYTTEKYQKSVKSINHCRRTNFSSMVTRAFSYDRIKKVLDRLVDEGKLRDELMSYSIMEVAEIAVDNIYESILADMDMQGDYYFEDYQLDEVYRIIKKGSIKSIERVIYNREVLKDMELT